MDKKTEKQPTQQIIFPNSTTNVIVIDKIEYFLLYKHDRIDPLSILSNSSINENLGQIVLLTKIPINGIYTQYNSFSQCNLNPINP